MQHTLDYLDQLPAWDYGESLQPSWHGLCDSALNHARADALGLIELLRRKLSGKLMTDIDADGFLYLRESHLLGRLVLSPGADYCKKTGQIRHKERATEQAAGRTVAGLELEISLIRRTPAGNLGKDWFYMPHIALDLRIHHGRELDAFRDVFDDYRGIVGKLLDTGEVEFSAGGVISDVKSLRSRNSLLQLGAALHARDCRADDMWFTLGFLYTPKTDTTALQVGFASLCILFTCIQRAAVSSRARRDLILDLWQKFEIWRGTYRR